MTSSEQPWIFIGEDGGPAFENGWHNVEKPTTLYGDFRTDCVIFTLPPGYRPYSYWHRRRLTHPVVFEHALPFGFALVRMTHGGLRLARASRVEVLGCPDQPEEET